MKLAQIIKGENLALRPALSGGNAPKIRLSEDLALDRGCLHEALGPGREGFAGMVGREISGALIWIGRGDVISTLNPCGLGPILDPGRILLVQGLTRKECLWAAEQALRTRGTGCVVLDLRQGPDLTESRRLQIAAEAGGMTGIILIAGRARTSCARTRWMCMPEAGTGLGQGRTWNWTLLKHKFGRAGCWRVRWKGTDHAPDYVPVAAATAA